LLAGFSNQEIRKIADIVMMFESLDFLYVPAPDIEASVQYYTKVLGGRLQWKIHAYGVWVACVKLAKGKPYVLLADHIDRKDMMLIYRVVDLDDAAAKLRSMGWKEENRVEIPPGPCCTFRDPAGNALVIYESVRPFIMQEFKGKIDKPVRAAG
jgi:catechol 2,3-dioxygenase-like lactoylglutathione lyase family enzyme